MLWLDTVKNSGRSRKHWSIGHLSPESVANSINRVSDPLVGYVVAQHFTLQLVFGLSSSKGMLEKVCFMSDVVSGNGGAFSRRKSVTVTVNCGQLTGEENPHSASRTLSGSHWRLSS